MRQDTKQKEISNRHAGLLVTASPWQQAITKNAYGFLK